MRIDENSDAWHEGWFEGFTDEEADCPYDEGSREELEWKAGYKQGKYDCTV